MRGRTELRHVADVSAAEAWRRWAEAQLAGNATSRPDSVASYLLRFPALNQPEISVEELKALLDENLAPPTWEDVAQRCLACTNCTLVCPTCFCSTTEDSVSLDSAIATRSRRWDSCFTLDFSGVHGVPVRSTTKERYRQWMTHKLATWHDQFGSSGCVGCGRCITWCPVGIDITEEVAAIRATESAVA